MKNKYRDLIEQTFDFPQAEFQLADNQLHFHHIDLNALVKKYGTPFKFSYLPVIGEKIDLCRQWFQNAFEEHNYKGKYHYSYCTKSSHFDFVLKECLKKQVNIETSSAFDIDIIIYLFNQGLLNDDIYVLCNGYKTKEYILKIAELIDLGFHRIIPIIDSFDEFEILDEMIDTPLEIGIRIASEEDPKFEFYTSRLGIGYKDIVPFFKKRLKGHPKFKVSMLHFFVNTGIRDNAYYWNELRKFINVYTDLIKADAPICHLDIGGGFPIKNSLAFEFDYQYMITEIVAQIKQEAESVGAEHPNIFTEFGSFTVAESGGTIYSVVNQKKQNDKEQWNMIDSSFMTTLPDTWAINKRFVMLPINRWGDKYERVFLGGMTCDSDDYYNSEQHINAIYLPEFKMNDPLYIGFFNTGAYQESISGYGGIKHCLIPSPKHIIIDKDENGAFTDYVYREEQTSQDMLQVLGYR
ncbi:type III PLP-dependent enzyme domain-containing protein [Sediminitomix flava]|nr:arginine decarboxylase [Sediminitomix flava]